ncbi:MAG: FISUMP domain-containing protein [Bacteroidales bacterium]
MKKLTTILLFFSIFLTLSRSQDFADGISYQAVALDENGREISETDISVRFSILGSPELTEEHLYQEVHITDTDVRGLFTVIIGHGTVTESSLTDAPGDIDWGANDLYLAVEIDINNEGEFRLMGVQQMMHVPFAMHAASARSYSMQSGSWHDPEEAVFQVKNSSGEVVFAVYESGVEINVGEGTSKGSRGGFAVGGFSSQKQGQGVEYLRVDPGFVGVNIDDITDLDGSKGSRGGFAVGGFSAAKSGSPDYINISPQGTEIFLEQGLVKGTRGGFAVGGFSPSKSYLSNDYLVAGGDSVRVYIDDSENEKGSRGGFAVGGFSAAKGEGPEFMRVDPGYLRFSIDQEDESKGSRGGFAVGGFSSQKGGENDYLSLTPGLAQFAYDTLLAKGSRGGFAVGGFSSQKNDPVSDYLYITADSVRMSIMSPATKSTRGGFAIAERSSAKSPGNDIFYLTPDITEIYTKDGGSKLLGGFTVYGFDEFQQEAGLFQVTEQVTTVTTVFAVVPVVSTGEITDISTDSATGNGEVLEDGFAEVTGRGLVWGTSPGPRVSANEGITEEENGPGAFTSAVTGLSPGLLYYLRAYATNKAGSGYGEEKIFYTDNIITATSGDGGSMDPEGEIILERDEIQVFTISPDSGYEIDDVTLGGISVLGNVSIDEGTGIGTYTFTNNITGPKTLAATFRVLPTVEDIEGNVYDVVKIGTQVWMAENLRTTKYNDGTDIPTGHSDTEWSELTTGAYAIYPHASIDGLNSDAEVLEAYGAFYNWYAVETGNLCPTGWRLPTDTEWSNLTDYAGGESIAGGKLKSTRTDPDAHPRWESPNTGATDEYDFSALPGGSRYGGGTYNDVGSNGRWWSSTESDDVNARGWEMSYDYEYVLHGDYHKWSGFAVRCIEIQEFAGGSGTEGDPYIVTAHEHLYNVRNYPDAYFRQEADIDLEPFNESEGPGWMPIGDSEVSFTGSYDGGDYVLYNLMIDRSGEGNLGLFGYATGAVIRNLGIENAYIYGSSSIGGVAGLNNNSVIDNVFVTGDIMGDSNIGGITGHNTGANALISNSYADAFIESYMGQYAGGLAGINDNGAVIDNSYSIGFLYGDQTVGGLVGWNGEGSSILNSYSNAEAGALDVAGGLVGNNEGAVENSYSTGWVSGEIHENLGGLIGITNWETASVTSSYWNTETSEQGTSDGGEGKTHEEMMQQETFIGWDFVNIWDIAEFTHPFLQWQGEPGEHNYVTPEN